MTAATIVKHNAGTAMACLALFGLAVAGCGARPAGAPSAAELTTANQIGAGMQKNGIMSQASYVRIRELGHSVGNTHTISDADLGFTLSLLGSATNSIARARAMTVLSEIHPMSPAQKASITPAIAPYLNSSDKLDHAGAQRVERTME